MCDRMKLDSKNVNRREIARYLGYQGITPDDSVNAMVEEVLDELLHAIAPRNLYQRYDCHIEADTVVLTTADTDGEVRFTSRNLSDNLRGCPYVILMAATLGIEADKLLHRYEMFNMAKASILQSCAAASIEACCDMLQEELRVKALEQGLYLRPRFSPGYGDLPLSAQTDFFHALDITKRLGVTLTDSLLMYPTKSVTAFIGLTPTKEDCHIGGCQQCNHKGCEYRNETMGTIR